MMNRAPLAPTTITDKNGVLTTRHKKTAAGTTSTKAIPAPQVSSLLTDWQVNELVSRFNTRKGTAATAKLEAAVRKLSPENYAKMEEFLITPVRNSSEHHSARPYLGIEMLTKPASVSSKTTDIGWKLDAALTLSRGSTMNSTHYLMFAHTLSHDERYTDIVNDMSSATDQDRQHFCDIASAITKIAKHYSERITNKTPINERSPFIGGIVRVDGKKRLEFHDQSVVDALLDHPDKAEAITDLYLERGSIDALDEVLSVPAALSEGAL